MKKLLALAVLCALGPWRPAAAADPLVWKTPYGTFGLPFTATEALIGYDGIIKEAIAGFSLPIYTDAKGLITLQVGAVAPWQTNQATIQPYIAAGHDILREIPYLSQFQSAHLNAFGRWDSGSGKAGAGLSASYAFAGGKIEPVNPAPTPEPSPTSRLNLYQSITGV